VTDFVDSEIAQRKWDRASRNYDLFTFGDDRRLGPHKRRLFQKVSGATLMVAAGTGNDFKFFSPGVTLTAIDISPKMLERAEAKASAYAGRIELRQMDVCNLDLPAATFDTVVTVSLGGPYFFLIPAKISAGSSVPAGIEIRRQAAITRPLTAGGSSRIAISSFPLSEMNSLPESSGLIEPFFSAASKARRPSKTRPTFM